MSTNRSRALRWWRSRRIVAASVLALSLLPTALLAAPPTAAGEPQPAPRGEAALTRGAWVGRTAAGSTAFRLVLDGGRLSGHSYLLRDGKAISEVPVAEATLETANPPRRRATPRWSTESRRASWRSAWPTAGPTAGGSTPTAPGCTGS